MGQHARSIDESTRSATSRHAKDDGAKYQAADLDQFHPERWLRLQDGETQFNPRAAPMQSFGSGIRACFGESPAQKVLPFVVCGVCVC